MSRLENITSCVHQRTKRLLQINMRFVFPLMVHAQGRAVDQYLDLVVILELGSRMATVINAASFAFGIKIQCLRGK